MGRAIVKGALVGTVAGVLLLAGLNVWAYPSNRSWGVAISALILYLFLAGPGAAVAGGAVGAMAWRWRQRGLSRAQQSLRSGLLGALLGNGVAFATLGFLYSFGAIANRLSIPQWIGSFWAIFLAFVPLALPLGFLCGLLVGTAVGPHGQNPWHPLRRPSTRLRLARDDPEQGPTAVGRGPSRGVGTNKP